MSEDPFATLAPIPAEAINPPSGEIEMTEDGIARAFVARHGEVVRYDHQAHAWFLWAGDHWRRDTTSRVFNFARVLAREASVSAKPAAFAAARKASTAAGVERLARTDPSVAVTGEAWDADPMLLGAPGATIDLRDGAARLPDPADQITKRVAVAPGAGPCPRWHEFLLWATGGDEDVLRFLQVYCGYLLTGQTTEHVLLFVHGPGGNGKSVFLNTVSRLLGDYATTAAMDTFTVTRGERHPADLAMLRGARMVSASETEEGRAWAESRIKAMTGGDPITARFMRGDFFTYQPAFKLILVGNHQPVLRNVDPAIRRRFLLLPFTRTPARADPDLESKLWSEAPQILAWAIRGCLEWQAEGLPRPEAITAATDQYFADQDVFGEWIAQHCRIGDPADQTTAADLFASWRTFAEAAGERQGTQKALGNRLRHLGLSAGKCRVGDKTLRAWQGIALSERGNP